MKRFILSALGWLLLLVVAVGFAAPFFRANRYHDRIQTALTEALGRKVTIGDVHLDLFTGPGFSVSDVVIGGDPEHASSGQEPFAYVGELRAVPRIWSLWTRRLEFASLTLMDAHVNLTRASNPGEQPTWNFESLLKPGLLQAFPTVRLRDARINFVTGGRKSTFYLLDTDLDISPRSRSGDDWDLRVTGEPARTDRMANGFGSIQANGRWTKVQGAGRMELDVRLDRSEIGDMVALVNGYDAGVHGLISGQVHIAGPAQSAGIEGEVRISELHGWQQSPPPGGVFVFRVSGTTDLQDQRIELFAEPRGGHGLVKSHIAAVNFLQNPLWNVEIRSDALPIAPVTGLMQNFGAHLPDSLSVSGTLAGEVRYSPADGWTGSASLRNAAVTLPNAPPLNFDQAALAMNDGVARLTPVSFMSSEEPMGTVGGNYSLVDGAFDLELHSFGGPVAPFLRTFPVASVPLLSALRSANWTGDLRYTQPPQGAGGWAGIGELTNAVADLPELAAPLQIAHAHVEIEDHALDLSRMDLRAGAVQIGGEYRYVPGVARPHQFRLNLESPDAGQLQTALQPVLERRSSLFDMAFTLGSARVPEWLRTMHAEGSLQANQFALAGVDVNRVRSHVQWDGAQILLTDWQSRMAGTNLTGRLMVDARSAATRYTAALKWNGLDWEGGHVDGTIHVQTAGSGLAMLENLKVDGTFRGRDLEVQPIGVVENLTGTGEVSWAGTRPRFLFPALQIVSGGETWTGTGASDGNGEVLVQLTSNGKQMNLAGSLTDPTRDWVAQ